jgi:hypothetical protein
MSGLPAAALAAVDSVALGASLASAAPTLILSAAKPATASCPQNCLVEARVTGFQRSIGEVRNPFVVPERGEIVAWSVKLGKPRKADRRAFNREFGASVARISVLRRVKGSKSPPRYKLLRQGPAEDLGPFFGSTTTFTLTTPMPVGRGDIVALTIPSWAPAFAVGQGGATRWVASRRPTEKRGGCTTEGGFANVEAGSPQQKKGSQRPYGCTYDSARLLYSATFVAG